MATEDVWADVRELFVFEAPIDSDDDEQQLFRSLLTDADALLAVVREAQKLDTSEVWWLIDLENSLAALPEHLKE